MQEIKAVIFDMDGLLVDSEPLWREAEKIVFREAGLEITDAMCRETMGMRTREVIEYWYKRHPWENPSISELEVKLLDIVEQLILEKAEAMPGVGHILTFFRKKGVRTGLATSSPTRLIHAVLEKFRLYPHFEVLCSAEHLAKGKPNPKVYLNAAKALSTPSQHCLAFEDSYNGLRAAKNAGMKTVVIPDQESFNEKKFNIADLKLRTLSAFSEKHFHQLSAAVTTSP